MIGRPRPEVSAVAGYVPGKSKESVEQETGITDVVKLASNERTAPPASSVAAAMATAAGHTNRYPDNRATVLRSALATKLDVSIDSIAVSSGSVGLLQQITAAYGGPGRSIAYPWRSFELYPIFTKLSGAREIPTPLTDDWAFDVDALIAAIAPDTSIINLATPNNPTGTALTPAQLEQVIEAVPDDVIIVVDEAYREYVVADIWDPVELVAAHPNVVHLRTFSKAYALAAARVGWCHAHPDVIACIHATQPPFPVTNMGLAGALAGLADVEALESHVEETIAERARVVEALRSKGWAIPSSQEGNFVWMPTTDAVDITASLEQKGVIVRPFAGEGIRVTIGQPHENDRFLDALG